MLTIEEAHNLKYGDIIYQLDKFNADGSCRRWRVSGNVKLWKRDLRRFRVPIKNGLYNHDHLDESFFNDNDVCDFLSLTEDV